VAVAVDVYLVRHAIAEERDAARWPDDSLRPLTAEGAESFRHAARGLRRIVPEVESVLASSYVRAWQTAEILEREAGWPAPERCEALEGNLDPEEARAVILALRGRGSVALVGHDPHLLRLASLLLTGDPDGMRLELKKGGVVHLALEPDEEPTASLHASVTPKALGHLPFRKATFEDYVGDAGRKRLGKKKWPQAVEETVERLTAALEPDYVVLGGGNAKKLDSLPPNVRLGANNNAFVGAFRLWGRELSASPL
jgi:phosphohistidine phosphatase SixA